MSMTDFIPRTKKRQLATRPHSLTVPKELRFGELPPELAKHPEEGLWIIHLLFGRRLYDSRRENADQWIPLNFETLSKVVRHKHVKKWLSFLDPEIIVCRGDSYQSKVKSKEYRMSEKYRHQTGRTVTISDRLLIPKLDEFRGQKEDWQGDATLEMLRKNLDRITIRRHDAVDYIYHEKDYTLDPDIKNAEYARNADETSIEALASGHRFFIVDDYRRIHSNLTNLSSDLRTFLMLKRGKDLSLSDIRNSQPLIFGCLLHELLGMRDTTQDQRTADMARRIYQYADAALMEDERKRNRKKEVNAIDVGERLAQSVPDPAPLAPVPPLPPTPLCLPFLDENNDIFSINSFPDMELQEKIALVQEVECKSASEYRIKTYEAKNSSNLTFCTELAVAAVRLAKLHKSEIDRYCGLCSGGLLYEFFGDLVRDSGVFGGDRNKLKREFFRETIYCKNPNIPDRELRDIFAREFPGVWKIANLLKSAHHSVLPKMMQFLESGYIRSAVEFFHQKHQNRFIATIHDALMVEHDLSNDADAVLRSAFKDVPIKLTIERLSWHVG